MYLNNKKPIDFLIFIITLIAMSCVSCDPYQYAAQKRVQANESGDSISIAIVDSSTPPSFFMEGVKLAIAEINLEGILGKHIKPIYYDDLGDLDKAHDIARTISKNPNVVAVIGHRFSDIAIPVSITYEQNGILFISPGATQPDLIRDNTVYTFRNIPSHEIISLEIAKFALRNQYKKIVVIYDRESSGKRLAEIFQERAMDLDIKINAVKSYSSWHKDFRLLIADIMKQHDFDAIFIGGILPSAALLIKQIRDMGLNTPILGGDALDSPELWNIAGKGSQGTIVATVFDPKQANSHTRDFVKKFKSEYGLDPDTWAAQGYDAIKLLAHVFEKSGSTVPIVVGTTLRFLDHWESVTGSYSFTRSGDITDKAIYFKVIKNGNFEFLERELRIDINPFEAVEDVTLRLPVEGIISTIDPGMTDNTTSIDITEQLFLGLTDFDPKTYEPIPELASKWEIFDNGKLYVFHLRKDAKWTNGEPVTAHDIVWTIQRNIAPDTKCPNAFFLYVLKNAKGINSGIIKDIKSIGVRAIDDFTVEFQLEYPAAYFPGVAGLWVYRPIPRKAVETFGDKWTEPENIQTNGSYKLAAWFGSMVMILRKNQLYYDADKVSIPEVRYYIIPESKVGLAMYKNNELDILGDSYLRIPVEELPNIHANPVLSKQYNRVPLFCSYAYAFNTKLPPVDNPLVRKAISAAIDRELIVKLVTKGEQEIATTFTRPPIFGAVSSKENVGIAFRPFQARAWLAQAGYPDGKGFPEITLLCNESETHIKIAKAVKSCLKHYLNIDVKIKELEWSEYMRSRTEHLPEAMIRFGWCSDYPDANNWLNELFNPDSSDNIIGWNNREFAKLMEQAQNDSNIENRKQFYKRAEQILCEEECAVVPIFFETGNYLINPRVKGWYNMALGGQRIRDWYFASE